MNPITALSIAQAFKRAESSLELACLSPELFQVLIDTPKVVAALSLGRFHGSLLGALQYTAIHADYESFNHIFSYSIATSSSSYRSKRDAEDLINRSIIGGSVSVFQTICSHDPAVVDYRALDLAISSRQFPIVRFIMGEYPELCRPDRLVDIMRAFQQSVDDMPQLDSCILSVLAQYPEFAVPSLVAECVRCGYAELMERLVEGFGLAVDYLPDLPLSAAVQYDRRDCFMRLIAMGADPDACRFTFVSPLVVAVVKASSDSGSGEWFVRACLDAGASPNGFCNSPLILAAHYGLVRVARLLLEAGASANEAGYVPATIEKDTLSHGERPSVAGQKWYPIDSACHEGHLAVVSCLCDAGADLSLGTSLEIAIVKKNSVIVNYLLDQLTQPDVLNAVLARTVKAGNDKAVNVLLRKHKNKISLSQLGSCLLASRESTLALILDRCAQLK